MKSMTVGDLTLFYEAEDMETAQLVSDTLKTSVSFINSYWGLETPSNCRVYIMTSWMRFFFSAAPWYIGILITLSLPFNYFRLNKIWKLAGGWMQVFGNRPTVGVKPPRLIKAADMSIGQRIFVTEEDMEEKIRHITCHELVHAFTSHLKLPMWLNEGLAMLSVDKFLGKSTVKTKTLESLDSSLRSVSPASYRDIHKMDDFAFAYHFVRGYWITRYLDETKPDVLRDLLKKRYKQKTLETELADAFAWDRQTFWKNIDDLVIHHFKEVTEVLPVNDVRMKESMDGLVTDVIVNDKLTEDGPVL